MDLKVSVESLVDDLVNNKKAFTAFDVTSELREMYPSDTIYHYEVRPIVHDYMANILDYYGEQNFNLNNNGPIEYKPSTPINFNSTASVTTSSLNGSAPAVKTVSNVKSHSLPRARSRNRLNIPGSLITEYLGKIDKVACVIKQGKIRLVKPGFFVWSNKQYKTDKYNSIKLSKEILESAGLDINMTFDLKGSKGQIEITNQ